jgi:hypothetical protein
MSPLPAASSRFIASSGDVCRYWLAGVRLRTLATTLSIAGSVAPALDNAGVSTSSTPRAAKNARTASSIAARCRNVSSDAPRS